MLRTPPVKKGGKDEEKGADGMSSQENLTAKEVDGALIGFSKENGGRNQGDRGNTGEQVETTSGTTRVSAIAIEDMKVKQLREQLEKLNLPTGGKKSVLVARLRDVMEREDEDDEDDEGEQSERDSESEQSEEEEQTDRAANGERTEDEGTRRVRRQTQRVERRGRERAEGDIPRATMVPVANTFTIKDVEGSISFFTGDDKMPIRQWISEFEDTSALLRWNELQMVIYGKKMLQGSAKEFIALERGLITWKKLKDSLIKEFEIETNSATIHSQLRTRRKQTNETSRQYIYAMQTIAKQGYVEDEAIIQYIIDGVQDDESNKQILYNSRSLKELKKNFELYDRMKERSGRRKQPPKEEVKSKTYKDKKDDKQGTMKKIRCFGCGSKDHEVNNCPHKEKGPKCFKCDQFGHIAPKCEKVGKSSKRGESVNCVTMSGEEVSVRLSNNEISALLDTGSVNTVLRNDEFRKISNAPLKRTERIFKGFGNTRTKAIGVFDAEIWVGDDLYRNEVYVVPVEVMDSKMLLGKDIQKQMVINIDGGKLTIRKKYAKDEELAVKRPNEDEIKETDSEEGVSRQLLQINYVDQDTIEVREPYKQRIQQLMEDHKPSKQVQTNVETKIVLKDDEVVCAKPRRLSIQEKDILEKQVDEWLKEGIVRRSIAHTQVPWLL
ncbi:uncharacterized protein [Venturia canescens]|uniref:uncharacterized protein n=1 Tax=Venturia canescens TaxID=32260 RepID=UPI001C9D02F5|nr:uncharacterized protein LOC122411320 [Venturia canescens]